nr:Toll-like receptor 3 [Arenicola marina]
MMQLPLTALLVAVSLSSITSGIDPFKQPVTHAGTPGTTGACPSQCSCDAARPGYSAACQGGYPSVVIGSLPPETSHLKYTFKTFSETNISFSHLTNLVSLELTSDDLWSYGNSGVITREDFFRGLERLQELMVHLNLNQLTATALTSLAALTSLDLSHTRSLGKDAVGEILEVLKETNIALKRLIIRNIWNPNLRSPDSYINLREDIVQYLKCMPLMELDVSDNGAILYNPGLIEFVPGLQSFISLGNEATFDQPRRLCDLMDFLFHPALTSLSVSLDVFVKRFSPRATNCLQAWISENSADTKQVCRVVACICANFTAIPCQYIPRGTDLAQFEVHGERPEIVIPTAPGLEHLQVVTTNGPMYNDFMSSGYNVRVLATKPNVVRNVDIQFPMLTSRVPIPLPIVRGLENATYVRLRSRGAKVVLGSILREFSSVTNLAVGGNALEVVHNETNVFSVNPSLQILDLSECGLSTLEPLGLASLPRLRTLDVSLNDLREFAVNISRMSGLQLLNVSHNRLMSLPQHVTDALGAPGRNISIDLSGNPLVCGCGNLDFVAWLTTTRVEVTNDDTLTCIHPTRGLITVSSVAINELTDLCLPSSHHGGLIAYTVVVTCAILFTALVLIYRNRYSIRFYLCTTGCIWKYSRPSSDVERFYKYDAFVIFSSDDQDWVQKVLLPTMEQEYDLRLCVHYRDFLPGSPIAENITESLEQSRKTILVLTPSFVQSQWCLFETSMATSQMRSSTSTFVIPVILTRLSSTGMPKVLTNLMKSRTYLLWTEDFVGQQLFMEKLVLAVTDNAIGST